MEEGLGVGTGGAWVGLSGERGMFSVGKLGGIEKLPDANGGKALPAVQALNN